MAHLLAHVPQAVENELDDRLDAGRLPRGQHEEKIDIGTGRQGAAAITPDGHHRDRLKGRPLADGKTLPPAKSKSA